MFKNVNIYGNFNTLLVVLINYLIGFNVKKHAYKQCNLVFNAEA